MATYNSRNNTRCLPDEFPTKQVSSHQQQTLLTKKSSQLHHQPTSKTRSRKQNINSLHRLPSQILLLSFTLLLTCITPIASASAILISEQMVESGSKGLTPPVPALPEDHESALSRLAKSAPILVDLSPPPKEAAEWMLANLEDEVRRRKRQVGGEEEPSSSKIATSTKNPSSTTRQATTTATSAISTTPEPSRTGIAVAEETSTRPLPTAFDSGFNGNLTKSCRSFMTNMLTNEVFKSCLPFSLLLQNSNAFFQTARSVTLTTRLLDYTCGASPTTCFPLISNFASNITSLTTCGNDLTAGNPQIQSAQLGLLAYRPLFTASCLRNSRTSSYCFADAVTNTTSPGNSYMYYLPLNLSPDPEANLTCNQCLRDTMAVFSSSEDGTEKGKGANKALTNTYPAAAQMINARCGNGYVNATMAVSSSAAFRTSVTPSMTALFMLVLLVSGWLL